MGHEADIVSDATTVMHKEFRVAGYGQVLVVCSLASGSLDTAVARQQGRQRWTL